MNKINDRWSALSMKDRAALIDIYIKSGITDLGEMRKSYNGIPYRDLNTSEYDYFNAASEMAPTKEGQHWDSRNPYTGRLLKREDHPTFDLTVEGEKQAGYKIIRGYNGELYSIPNEPTNYVEEHNSFDYGGDTESPVDMGELEASFINPKQSRVNRRREVRRAFKSIKNLIKSDEIDSQDILNAYNGLNENQRKRALEAAMKFSPIAQPNDAINSIKQHVLHKPRQAFKTLRYIMTGKGKPSLFSYGYSNGYNGLWGNPGDIENGIIDAMLYGTTVDPRIGTKADKNDFGPEIDYINKHYGNKNIQYIQTNPGVVVNQEGITPVSYTGSNGSFNTSMPGVPINNQGFILQKGTRNDSTFVRGLDVYDFKADDYSKKWDTENMYPVLQQIDSDTNPVAIKTPWVPEEEINTILSDKEGYTPYKNNGGKLNKFATGGPTNQNVDSNWLKSFKELPDGYKKAVLQLVTDLNYDVKDAESLYNSGKLKAVIEAKYQNTPSGRVRQNDSPTSTESSNLEKKMNRMLYHSTDRILPNMKYAIPYIEELEIKVPGVGRTTTNALDSLAKYAVQAQIPLSEALGLSAQETAFGALPQYNYVEVVGTEEEKQKARDFNRALGNSSYFRNYGIIPAENFVRDFRYNIVEDPIDRDVPPLLHAFNYWKKGNYNRGDSDHTKDVKAKGEAVMKTKVIQDWINSSKFAQKALNLSK